MTNHYHDYYEVCAGVPVPEMNIIMVAILTAVTWGIRSALWKQFMRFSFFVVDLPNPQQAVLEKVSKYTWHGVYYVVTSIWAAVLIYYSPAGFSLQGTVSEGCHDNNLRSVHFFFCAQMAWYIHGMLEIILYDANRRDFWLMIAHHVLSMVLIYGSLVSHLHRIGLVVMLEQDLSDVALYVARILQKRTSDPETGKPKNLACQKMHTCGVILMSVMWLLCRKIVLCAVTGACWVHIYYNGFFHMPFWRQALLFFLNALLLMQIIWGMALFRMCYEQIRKGAWTEYYFDVEKKKDTANPCAQRN